MFITSQPELCCCCCFVFGKGFASFFFSAGECSSTGSVNESGRMNGRVPRRQAESYVYVVRLHYLVYVHFEPEKRTLHFSIWPAGPPPRGGVLHRSPRTDEATTPSTFHGLHEHIWINQARFHVFCCLTRFNNRQNDSFRNLL